MPSAQDTGQHFAQVSTAYRNLRTTDEAPILHIRDKLKGVETLNAADIGCGAGRYDLLLFQHLPGLRLQCVDVSAEMLAELSSYLTAHGVRDYKTVVSRIEDLNLSRKTFDCIVTFNAVHHFEFPTFLRKSAEMLKPDGRIFVYTRTPQQNMRSIWGRYFPEFNERETRLYPQERMEGWVAEAEALMLREIRNFRYVRCLPLERLLHQARGRHYSTFSLYSEVDFHAALEIFENRVRADFPDEQVITWHDENIMLEVSRTGRT